MKIRFIIYGSVAAVMLAMVVGYSLWDPGDKELKFGNKLNNNAMWISHGWIGDDSWFKENNKDKLEYSAIKLKALSVRCADLKVKFVYPHLCPAAGSGRIPGYSPERIAIIKAEFKDVKVLPWIGGSTDSTVDLGSAVWRKKFIDSAILLCKNKDIDGIHLNIEPLPSGDRDYIVLLGEIKAGIGGKALSVAAYPPPTVFQPDLRIHWEKAYYKEISSVADQIVPMMYDTSIRYRKFYIHTIENWTESLLEWCGDKVIFGVPAYEDYGVGYHDPRVENVESALLGILGGINRKKNNYDGGVSIYSDWTLDDHEIAIINSAIKK